jgi:hypothetical protein
MLGEPCEFSVYVLMYPVDDGDPEYDFGWTLEWPDDANITQADALGATKRIRSHVDKTLGIENVRDYILDNGKLNERVFLGTVYCDDDEHATVLSDTLSLPP